VCAVLRSGRLRSLTLYADIASKWDGPHSLRVTVPDILDWRIELGSTPATVMMTALSHRVQIWLTRAVFNRRRSGVAVLGRQAFTRVGYLGA
jgi:hypothetical protein